MKVGIQGIRASFHDLAARKYFKNSELKLVECLTFPALFNALKNRDTDFSVMAIENALAGSILPNYALLERHGFKIVGEVFLKIEMSLLALPGVKMTDLKIVQSHPMALLQCQKFLGQLGNVQLVEHDDTADSAREISEKKLTNVGSIASSLAAEVYGLEILATNIESDPANYTRFLVLCREEDYIRSLKANKASIRFETEHRPGSLAKVLNIFEGLDINMSKIHSLPVIGKPYHFAFHVDLEWDDINKFESALEKLKLHSLNLTCFGEYPAGEKVRL